MKILVIFLLAVVVSGSANAKKKDATQVLELPKDPPLVIVAETRNLVFHVSPLSGKGLLTQQAKDAVKALLKQNNGATIVKVRAFVAGTGDMRRVPAIISEALSEKKLPLPVISVVQIGGLPLEGAQVVLESLSVAKHEVNPNGIVFIGGQSAASDNPLDPMLPLAEKSLAAVDKALSGVAGQVLSVTCFTSSREEQPVLHAMAAKRYPAASLNIIQMRRGTPKSIVECEAVAQLAHPQSLPFEMLNSGQAAAISAPKLALTGTQMAFGFDDKDARLAFQRLQKALQSLGSSTKDIAMANFYPLSNSIAEQVKRVRLEFFDAHRPPATTILPFEGLPAMEASFSVDVAAVINQ